MLLVVAWDGACFDITDPFVEAGCLPVLAGLERAGARRPLRSTWPAVTYPAWTSFMTAAGPGRHGLTDFTLRDGYTVRFASAMDRRLPTAWALMSAAGLRVGVYALPATYPPEHLNGIQVCGFDTPLGAGGAVRVTHPEDLAARLHERYGGLAIRGPAQAKIGAGWHARALDLMLGEIELRTRITCDLIREGEFDCFAVHFAESDTVAHQFWQLCDPLSPRFERACEEDGRDELPSAIERVYRALDESLGRLVEAAGAQSTLMLLSDHGTGGTSDRVVFWNRWLADSDFLAFGGSRLAPAVMRRLRGAALRWIPESLQADLFGRLSGVARMVESGVRLGGIDWLHTRAFSEELNYYPSIWLNLRGREPQGTVEPADAPGLVAELSDALRAFKDPFDGEPVVEDVLTRDLVFDGPYAGRAPDLILKLREPSGYSYAAASSRGGAERRALRLLVARERSGARGTSMAGSHRRTGMCVLAGPNVRPGRYAEADIAEAGATMLGLTGLAPTPSMDARPWSDAVDLGEQLIDVDPHAAMTPSEADVVQSAAAERELAAKLRALGYMD